MSLKSSPWNASRFRKGVRMSDRAEIVVEMKKLLASNRSALCKHDRIVFDIVKFLDKHHAEIIGFEGAKKRQSVVKVLFKYTFVSQGKEEYIIVDYKTGRFVEVYFNWRMEYCNKAYDKRIPFAQALEDLTLFDQIEEMIKIWNKKEAAQNAFISHSFDATFKNVAV